ncbi:MAG: NUDIX domain-containing protein [Anaerolineae bacterium]
MTRITRYQGAVVRGDHILLIKHREHVSGREYWVVPGGGREAGEAEKECVEREVEEETNLTVAVKALLVDEPSWSDVGYERFKTYLCEPVRGVASPGREPEPEARQVYAITEVGWFDLRNETTWPPEVIVDPFTYPLLQRIRAALGFTENA